MIRHGADVNARKDDGHTLLHILIDPAFLTVVLAAGATLESRDDLGRTPLMVHVSEADNFSMVSALLGARGGPHAADEEERSVLDYARGRDDVQIEVVLRQAGGTE